jgi:mRNA interferase MazF
MTSHKKGYPFEVIISDDYHQTSVVLADQVKSLDWKTRQAVKKGTASSTVVIETLGKLQTLL